MQDGTRDPHLSRQPAHRLHGRDPACRRARACPCSRTAPSCCSPWTRASRSSARRSSRTSSARTGPVAVATETGCASPCPHPQTLADAVGVRARLPGELEPVGSRPCDGRVARRLPAQPALLEGAHGTDAPRPPGCSETATRRGWSGERLRLSSHPPPPGMPRWLRASAPQRQLTRRRGGAGEGGPQNL